MTHVRGYWKKDGTYVRSHYRRNMIRTTPSSSSDVVLWIILAVIALTVIGFVL